MFLLNPSRERQQCDIPRLLDRHRQPVLMRRAHAGQAARHDLATLGHKLPEQTVILVIDVGDFLRAKLANFFAPEKLAPAFAWRTAGTASTAPKSRAISTRTVSAGTAFACGARRWCFYSILVSHNSPQSVASDS
jgi:hypothetical protein